MNKENLIEFLELEPLDEGGFFRRTYSSEASSIYYLLTEDSPLGILHINKSDIVHFYHMGGSVEYIMISPEGEEIHSVLGTNLETGERPQLLCPGGYLKAARLKSGSFCLLSEMVTPAFKYEDRSIVTPEFLSEKFPSLVQKLNCYLKK